MSLNNSLTEFRRLFIFASIDDEPLLRKNDRIIIVTLTSIFLIVGVLLNGRILTLLTARKSGVVIDKLMVSNTLVSGFGHSMVLTYYIASTIIYPLSTPLSASTISASQLPLLCWDIFLW